MLPTLKAEERQIESLGADLRLKDGNYLEKNLVPLKAIVLRYSLESLGMWVHKVKTIFIITLRDHNICPLSVEFSKVDVTRDSAITLKTMKKLKVKNLMMNRCQHFKIKINIIDFFFCLGAPIWIFKISR